MGVTFFQFKDMKVKITRPDNVSYRDKEIGNRAYELLKGFKDEDNWTKEVDNFIKMNDIKYEEANETEFKAYCRRAKEFVARIPGKGELKISK